jgi:2-polyprenyl-3-methyl-5-hydroxy-6-metoxy-1,4-benzoquinol methylase
MLVCEIACNLSEQSKKKYQRKIMSQQSISCPICNHATHYSFSGRDLMFNHFERFDYYQCKNCELIFQVPLPSAERISSFYPDEYDIYEEHNRLKRIGAFRLASLKRKFGYAHLEINPAISLISSIFDIFKSNIFEIPFIKNGVVLDIGCGNGRFLHGMQQLGWQTKGVEFNAGAVEVCKKSNLDVIHGDLFSANLADASFDVVNLSHVIEHVPDPKALFIEVARILKPDGLFIIKTPNSQALGRALFDTNWFANEVPRHLYLFSQKNLLELAKASSLNLLWMETNSTPKIVLNSVDYVVGNRNKPSKRVWWKRLLAKSYVFLSKCKKQGDEIHVVFKK